MDYDTRHKDGHDRNARFWVYINGSPVKLMLKKGQRLNHVDHKYHDEGYSTTVNQWESDGEAVYCFVTITGRDCDGRHEWFADLECSIEDLADGQWDHIQDIAYPRWENVRSSQRDYTAERMGY